MPRPRQDGQPPKQTTKVPLTERFVRDVRPGSGRDLYWDQRERGLSLVVHAGGVKSFRFTYRFGGRVRVYTLGRTDEIRLDATRIKVQKLRAEVAEGRDPQAEKTGARLAETFAEVAAKYLQYAQGRNKSWRHADALVRRYLLPTWGTLRAREITRGHVRTVVRDVTDRGAPIMANQILAAASAIFSWVIREEIGGIAVNPCHGVTRNPTQSRERVLSDDEIPMFWTAFDEAGLIRSTALKTILLTGQRPGEVTAMRWEHIRNDWWEMPGQPDPELNWPGTKNSASHRVFLSGPVRDLLAELGEAKAGFVFPGNGRGTRSVSGLDQPMRTACETLGISNRATPHDLRRTHGTTITGLGFGRDAMNRIQNHKEGGIAGVYDRHGYAKENQEIQEDVARRIMTLIEVGDRGNVVPLRA
jgi:integrase